MNVDWFTVIVEFGATFLGVFGAYYTTDYYDKRQKRKDAQERKVSTLTAIRNELDFNKELLSGVMKSYVGNQIFQEVIFSTTGAYHASLDLEILVYYL